MNDRDSFDKECFLKIDAYNKHKIVDQRQRGGRLVPVFGPPTNKQEEEYMLRWIERDRELGYY